MVTREELNNILFREFSDLRDEIAALKEQQQRITTWLADLTERLKDLE